MYSLFFVLMISNAFAQSAAVEYKDGEQVLSGIAVNPQKALKNKAGVLILPAWMGITGHEKETASRLANMGYYTFVADIYGEGNYPSDMNGAAAQSSFYKKNFEQYQNRIRLALEELIKSGANPDKIVVIGYCFGGTGAIETFRGNLPVKGVVSFHGGLGKVGDRVTKNSVTKVLVCHGADDPYESQEEIKAFQNEMREAKADWQMIYYANAVHSFTNPEAGNDNSKGAAYNEKADKRSWEHLLVFLKEILKSNP